MEVRPGYKQTEVGVIPEDWDAAALGSVCSMKSGASITSASIDPFSDYPCYGGNGLRGFTARFTHEGFYALIGRQGALCGNVLGVEGKFFASEHAIVVTPSTGTDIRWLTFVLKRMRLNQYSESSAQPGLSVTKLLPLAIALPPTKAEQEAIAEALSDADTLIESLEQLLTKKRRLKQGAMQELLTGEKRLPGFEIKRGYKQTEVGVIPKDWELKPLLKAVRIAQGQVDPKIEPYKSMYLVGPVHVESGTGKLIICQTAEEQGAISGKYLFAEGDIVYGKINPYLQKAFIADFGGLCSADMYPLKPSKDVSSGFMLAVILGHQFTKYAESVSVRSGMPKINRVEMGEFVFPIPADKAEQTAIAAIFTDMAAEIAALETKLAKARQLKQGMMQELLTGRIRLV